MKDIQIRRDRGPVAMIELETFEQLTGYRLPQGYKFLLSEHNALFPLEPDFKFYNTETESNDIRDVTFYGFGDAIPDHSKITRVLDHDVIGHEGVIAFGSAANGDYICFDYRKNAPDTPPRIVIMFHDQRNTGGKMPICFIANSFEDFIAILHEADEDEDLN